MLARTKGVRVDYVVEQVTARHPSSYETQLLGILTVCACPRGLRSGHHASGNPVVAVDVAMPGDLHELEDAYPVG